MSLPKFTCIQCLRRLSRLAQSSKSSRNLFHPPQQQLGSGLSQEHTPLPAPRRLYATAFNRRVARSLPTADTFAKVRFTRDDVPPREFWDAHARAPLVTDLSADECLQAAQAYADAAIKNAPGWRERLIVTTSAAFQPSPDNNSSSSSSGSKGKGGGGRGKGTGKQQPLSAYTLHYVAVMIATRQPGQAAHMATHILHTLTLLDYVPSILTLARMALRRGLLGQPQFEPALQGLERTLRRIGDGSGTGPTSRGSGRSEVDLAADACTLRALIYAAEDTREGDANALRWYRRAYEVGTAARPAASGTADQASSETQTQTQQQAGGKASSANNDSKGAEGSNFDPNWQWKPSFALGVARIRMKHNELDKAREMYLMASSGGLDTAAGYLGLANVLEKMGKADTAEYAEALEKAAVSGDVEAARKMADREWDRAAQPGLGSWERRKRQVVAEEWMGVAGSAAPAEA